MPGSRRKGEPSTAWNDDVKDWTGLTLEKVFNSWQKVMTAVVSGAVNP